MDVAIKLSITHVIVVELVICYKHLPLFPLLQLLKNCPSTNRRAAKLLMAISDSRKREENCEHAALFFSSSYSVEENRLITNIIQMS